MARVRSLEQGDQAVTMHPTEVDVLHQVIWSDSGEPILHLSSLGSDNRASKPKVSQTLQFDVEMARKLGGLLASTFGEAVLPIE